jgi:hypothetical protein
MQLPVQPFHQRAAARRREISINLVFEGEGLQAVQKLRMSVALAADGFSWVAAH